MSIRMKFGEVIAECENEVNFMVYLPDGTEAEGYFTNSRVDRSTLPEGWYAYDIREGEEEFAALEPSVTVNHGGTFITNTEIPINEKGYFDISDNDIDGGYTFL